MARELDDSIEIGLLVVRQQLRPSRIAQKARCFLIEIAQQCEVIAFDLIRRDRLFQRLLQVEVVREALV
ncbi:hypothetical protein D3C73_597020 [compost metagenome]